MDFTLTEVQSDFAELAAQVLHVDDAGLCEATDADADRDRWRRLADAGLLRAVLPSRFGGAGLGAVGTALLLEEVGRNAVTTPVAPALALAVVPLAAANDALVDDVVSGTVLAVGAYQETPGESFAAGTVTARPTGTGSVALTGTKTAVAAADAADALVVSARFGDDTVLAVVEQGTPGVTISAGGPVGCRVDFTDAPGRVVLSGAAADEALDRTWQHALLASAATVSGACARALHLTCAHIASRRQFGRALAEFQVVSLRAADAHIDVESIRMATLNAAWHLDEHGSAPAAVLVAKAWAGDGGNRVLRTAHHLHGGLGVDLSYPLHVLSRLIRREELTYGPPAYHIARIGDLIAAGVIDQES